MSANKYGNPKYAGSDEAALLVTGGGQQMPMTDRAGFAAGTDNTLQKQQTNDMNLGSATQSKSGSANFGSGYGFFLGGLSSGALRSRIRNFHLSEAAGGAGTHHVSDFDVLVGANRRTDFVLTGNFSAAELDTLTGAGDVTGREFVSLTGKPDPCVLQLEFNTLTSRGFNSTIAAFLVPHSVITPNTNIQVEYKNTSGVWVSLGTQTGSSEEIQQLGWTIGAAFSGLRWTFSNFSNAGFLRRIYATANVQVRGAQFMQKLGGIRYGSQAFDGKAGVDKLDSFRTGGILNWGDGQLGSNRNRALRRFSEINGSLIDTPWEVQHSDGTVLYNARQIKTTANTRVVREQVLNTNGPNLQATTGAGNTIPVRMRGFRFNENVGCSFNAEVSLALIGTGQARITNLPFTAAEQTFVPLGTSRVNLGNGVNPTFRVFGQIDAGSNVMLLFRDAADGSAPTALDISVFVVGSRLFGRIDYTTTLI